MALAIISHLILGSGFRPASHMRLERVVSPLFESFLSDPLCLFHLFLKSKVLPMYFFSSPSKTVAWYMTFFWLQLFTIGQSSLCLLWQLQPPLCSSLFLLLVILLLWLLIICSIFLQQQYDTLMVLLFRIGRRGCPLGKCMDTRSRNLSPTLVSTASFQGGLNHKMSLFFLHLFLFLLLLL